jgi:hypothetical protein
MIGIIDVWLGLHRCRCKKGMDSRTFVLVMTDAECCAGRYGKCLILYCERQYWNNVFVSRRERDRKRKRKRKSDGRQ